MSSSTSKRSAPRTSSDERREEVLRAAVKEFALHGYHAASTSAIAKRAGISQPYIYALFPNKRELFLAAHRRCVERIRAAFVEAAIGKATPEERLTAMGRAYMDLLGDRDDIIFQLQAHAAAGEPELREPVREDFMRLYDDVHRISGAGREDVAGFMAKGMLLNVVAALDLPDRYTPVRAEA